MGKNFKTLGVGWAWETLRGVGHGTKTTYNAVSGIVGLQTAQRELQQQMAAGQLTPQQVCWRGWGWCGVCGWVGVGGGGMDGWMMDGRRQRWLSLYNQLMCGSSVAC